MNAEQLAPHFESIGARFKLQIDEPRWDRWRADWIHSQAYSVDVRRDRHGEHFLLRVPSRWVDTLSTEVLQTEPDNHHLLLMVRHPEEEKRNDRFLCGHDEREWFVAAVPGGASSVRQAMEALQPREVREAVVREAVSTSKRFRRRNRAFRRQGEWFFIPESNLVVDENLVLRNEPIRRGGGKPHLISELYRTGGEEVYVSSAYPNGLNKAEYRNLLRRQPRMKNAGWRVMMRNAGVYARGKVRHSDHATIRLNEWHRVVMNTETDTPTMSNVAFLD